MRRHSLSNRRAVSTVIGAVLMIIIVMMGFSVLSWQTRQMYAHERMVQEKADEDFERMSEAIEITDARVVSNKISLTVLNKGALATHLVSLYVTNFTNDAPKSRKFFTLDYHIAPGMSVYGIGPSLPITFQLYGVYGLLVVTERGNIASFVYGLELNPPTKAPPLTFTFDIRSFNYTTTSDGSPWQTKPRPAWQLQGGTNKLQNILLWVKCTNNGAKDVILSKYSWLFVEQPFPGPQGQHSYEYEHYFFIVDPSSTSATPKSYTDYSQAIAANQTDYETGTTSIVKFGANAIGSSQLKQWPAYGSGYTYGLWNSGTYGSSNPDFAHQYYSYIVVFWKYSGDNQMYSQYVPYVSITTT
jgi:hypothetical protein